MSGIICKQCGYENLEGSTICEICAEKLIEPLDDQSITFDSETTKQYIQMTAQQNEQSTDKSVEFFVMCPESQTKTVLSSNKIEKFFCQGCKKEHDVDGFLWIIEERELESDNLSSINEKRVNEKKFLRNKLVLEEINSHYRIDIDIKGGTLGRYGKYGAEFFREHNMLMVSGEHCMITNEYGNWVLRHMSRTNETKYNNIVLSANEPNLLEDGKILTLANAVSFIIRME